MTRQNSQFKRSIWIQDPRYSFSPSSFSVRAVKDVSLLASVDAAKKQIPPVPIQSLARIAEAGRAALRTKRARRTSIERYLRAATTHPGVGIPTAICMLSVLSKGRYPPMDKKVAAGLRRLRIVSTKEQEHLEGTYIPAFSVAYVFKVCPAWAMKRRSCTPREIDEYWASKGRK